MVAGGADSDSALLAQVSAAVEELDGELVRSPGAVTAAVNAGLAGARDLGADALVIAQDVELTRRARTGRRSGPRARVGEQARAHVTEHRRIGVAARQWADVLRAAVGAVPVA